MDEPFELAEFAALNLIGRSPAFVETLKTVKQIAAFDVSVTVYGETGTGKELVAQAIHYLSPRASHPFIPIDCGSLPDTIFENEIFGHERGAFTDANKTQSGLIEQANGGTLFLDEIEALSLSAQTTFLRFLQDRRYRALGGELFRTADVRVIAASNEDLEKLCDRQAFRRDLYYRLNVMPLTLPPLRVRAGDIALLSKHFLDCLHARYDQPARHLDSSALEWMLNHDWPGNVRELENMLHRAFLLADGDTINLEHLRVNGHNSYVPLRKISLSKDVHFNKARSLVIDDFEKHYLDSLMCQTGGNVSRAAKQAGKERRALGRLLKKHGIDPREYKQSSDLV